MITTYNTDQNEFLAKRCYYPSNSDYRNLCMVRVNPNERHQHMLGFGVAMTDSSCYILSKLDFHRKQQVLDMLFGQSGLNLNIARISVASSDFSLKTFSYDDVVDDVDMKYFSIEPDKEYVIPILKEILELKPELFIFSSPWSPPGWMKTGGSMCGGFMRMKYVKAFASYYVHFLQAYKEAGIPIQALTTQNEVETTQMGRMPACVYHPEIEMELVKALKPMLKMAGIDTQVWIHDHNYIMWDRVSWMLDDPEFKQLVDGVAFHFYGGNAGMLDLLLEKHPGLSLHLTEGGTSLLPRSQYETKYCCASITTADAITHGCCSVTSWNAILDQDSNPNIGPFNCGGMVTADFRTGDLVLGSHYKAFAHYSKFIKPGAVRIGARCITYGDGPYDPNSKGIYPVAFENEDGSQILIITNPGDTQVDITVRLKDNDYRVRVKPDSICTVICEG